MTGFEGGSRGAGLVIGQTLLVAVVGLSGATGCTRRVPVAEPTPVALNVPPPPPRVISTPPEPVAPTEATTVERPAPAARPSRGTRAASRESAPRPEPPRPEAPPEATAPPASTEAATGPLLRTPQTADEAEAEKRTREVLGRANGLLGRVNVSALAQPARQQYDAARRFVAQADQALLERNYVLASYLAEKAETLAKGLSR